MHSAFCIIINCGCGGTADALVSGSSVARRVGSNPVIRTNKRGTALVVVPFFVYKVVGFEIIVIMND